MPILVFPPVAFITINVPYTRTSLCKRQTCECYIDFTQESNLVFEVLSSHQLALAINFLSLGGGDRSPLSCSLLYLYS